MVDFMRQDELAGQTVEAVLNERHDTYGRFSELAEVSAELREVIRMALMQRRKILPADMDESLVMICSKVARIVNGDHEYVDSWRDIAGYATLIADRLEGRSR